MNSIFARYAALALIVLATGFLVYARQGTSPDVPASVAATPGDVAPYVAQHESSVPLPAFIASLMDACGGEKHSPAKRTILSQQIERSAEKYLTGNNRHAFVALLCLETRMGSITRATSSAGARGVAQLLPSTAKEEAVRCGFGEVTTEDLYDNELSLNLAACHYAKLVEDVGPALAAAAYNSGSASGAVKSFQKLLPTQNVETASYAALIGIILAKYLHDRDNVPKGGGHARAKTVNKRAAEQLVDTPKG